MRPLIIGMVVIWLFYQKQKEERENEAIKKVWYTVSTLLLILPLFTSVLGTTTAFAEENGESAQLVIHKRK